MDACVRVCECLCVCVCVCVCVCACVCVLWVSCPLGMGGQEFRTILLRSIIYLLLFILKSVDQAWHFQSQYIF